MKKNRFKKAAVKNNNGENINEPTANEPPQNELWLFAKTAVQMSGLGFYLVAVVGVCVYIGMKADDYFALNGNGRMAGILLGFPIAIISLWKKFRYGDK